MVEMIMRCIKGEEWPITSFKSFVNINILFGEEAVNFLCPAGHTFTLKDALKKGMFSWEDANRILADAKKLYDKDWSVHLPEDYLPDKEVEQSGAVCNVCKKKAQRWWREKSICCSCMAAFDNYLEGYLKNEELREVLMCHWGKASDLLWYKIFQRFIDSAPILKKVELEALFLECKKEARKQYGKKSKKRAT